MRTVLGSIAAILGIVGILFCVAAVVLGWRFAMNTVEQANDIAVRLDQGLTEADLRLARVEAQLDAIRMEIDEVRGAAETIADENSELPRIRAEIERLLDRLLPALDRIDVAADSLQSLAVGIRTSSDIADRLGMNPDATIRLRNAAETLDRGAAALDGVRAEIRAIKSARAVQLTRNLVRLVRQALAGSERLAAGLVIARQGIAVLRERASDSLTLVVWRIRMTALANTLVWSWAGLGQLCLIRCGIARRSTMQPSA